MSLMIGEVTNYVDPTYPRAELIFDSGIGLAFLLFGMQLASTFATNMSASLTTITNVRMGAAVTTAVYKKSLKLASKSRIKFPAGKINTFCGSDVTNIKQFITAANQIWSMPVQVAVALYLVSTLMQASTAVAAAVFVGIGSFSLIFGSQLGKYMKQYMEGQDKRTFILREFLYGVKIIKYQAQEESVDAKIKSERAFQVKSLRGFYFYLCIVLFILVAQQALTAPLTIVAYGALGNNMNPATVFVAYSLLSGLAGISGRLSSILSGFISSITSYKRLQEFLIAEEIDAGELPEFKTAGKSSEVPAIILESANFTWESVRENPADTTNKKTNSEKTASAPPTNIQTDIEMAAVKAEEENSDIFTLQNLKLAIKRGSLVAVVGATGSGKSSLLSAITGGMRKTDGNAVVHGTIGYCAQEPWIMSGTIEENITLLDSGLESVCNAAVHACSLAKDLESLPNGLGTQIGEKGINLSGGQKARIALARAIAKNPDIFVLDDPLSALDAHVGKEIFNNTISGPVMRGKTIILATHLLHVLPSVDQVIVLDGGKIVQSGSFTELMKDTNGKLFDTMKDYHLDEHEDEKDETQTTKTTDQLVENKKEEAVLEDRQVGAVTAKTYLSYCKAMGWNKAFLVLGFCMLDLAVAITTQLGLSAWTSDYLHFSNQMDYLYIYSALSIFGSLSFAISLLLVSIAASIFVFYRKSYRELKRLNATMQSPLSAHISETLSGLSTILAYSAETIFVEKQLVKMDQANLGTMLFSHAQYWFVLRLDCIGAFVTLALTMLSIYGVMNRSFVALALSATIDWSAGLNRVLSLFAELEATMISVERLNYYSHDLPHEPSRHVPKDGTLVTWPSAGSIDIANLEIIYESRPDHAVIKNLSIKISAGEKIGIVGRTGSGKSTLVDSLFRLMEPSKGTIKIDGVDIATVGLKKLRESVQMIPQNPTLFDGTVRSNIDYSGKHTDEEIWYSLESCGMKEYVSGLSEKLDSIITEGGSNLSAGQRQLLCLAKVLLEKSKILVMDEATSSVDAESDLRIQQLMTTQFKQATVISIAHRLNTIAAFDRVLVLDKGNVAEFDAPHILLSRSESIFSEMVSATGIANAAVIREIAESHYNQPSFKE
ncbi:Multidrug resistance-associated protein 1 [Physocladia obscura]|uniref:Multidrug resistance-associated protein 1 n=1 Tax=Physocladia obscura TaxID=109957 RepID=A0AAD5T4H0_9FUNG|nr:Multidrug resistance-associated protein 1 [Physocladia obscura]